MTRRLCSIFLVAIGSGLACLAVLSGQTRPSEHEPVKPCPADKPLGGHIEIDSEWNENGCRGSIRTVLRFPLIPSMPQIIGKATIPWTTLLPGGFSATEVNYELSTGGCSGITANNEQTCHAPGARKTGKVVLGKMGPFMFTPDSSASGSLTFNPLKPEISALVLQEANGTSFTPLECIALPGFSDSGNGRWQFGFMGLYIGPLGSSCTPTTAGALDYRNPFVICIPTTDCSYPADEASRRECVLHADRHAIIPFTGESSWTSPQASNRYHQGIVSYKVHWEICCGCGEGGAPPESTPDPCPSTLEADSRLKMNRELRAEKLTEARKAGAAYDENLKEALAHYPDYKTTIEACLIQSLVTKAIIACIAAPAEGAHIPHEVEAAMEFAEMKGFLPPMGMQMVAKIVEKIVNGEDPTTVLTKESSQNWSETIAVLKKVETLMEGRKVEEMEKSMEECLGTMGLSDETVHSAEKCVESFKAALEHLADFNKLANEIRQLDTDYPDLQYKAWAACVARARCQGTPESACADKKPPGNWPDVP